MYSTFLLFTSFQVLFYRFYTLSSLLDILHLFLLLDKGNFSPILFCILLLYREAIGFCTFWKNYDKGHAEEEKQRTGEKKELRDCRGS